jgi:RNA polymerase sigma factor (sigma-70 family)
MGDLGALVIRARTGDADAFGALVGEFQGVAVGYAFSLLGDFGLAEDAAQEAFFQAYKDLEKLREPKAFPGWFRRMVLGHCGRQARRRQPAMALIEEGLAVPCGRKHPAEIIQEHEVREHVQQAVQSLPDHERMVVSLFYIGGRSQAEIGTFLEIPVSTVKNRLYSARKRLRERMVEMVEKDLREQRPTRDLRQRIMKRIRHWQRFRGSDEEKVEMVASDKEWVRLLELEVGLDPMSEACRSIREQIASMEPCHEHYVQNVEAIMNMIAAMTPGRILDCGKACGTRADEAGAYCAALETWLDTACLPDGADKYVQEVIELLGRKTDTKSGLVGHLVRKLRDNRYEPYAAEEEDFERTESRIYHLEICNYNWKANLRIVLQEIGAGKRLFKWHVPDGYNAHGDCPDRVAELRKLMRMAAAWAHGDARRAGDWGCVLGERTPEKRWLVASLCKHVASQHKPHDKEGLLAAPSL